MTEPEQDEAVETVKRIARKRMASSSKFDRYTRALEEVIPGETREERGQRLADLHWHLFEAAPAHDPKAPRPERQPALPLEAGS